MEEIPENTQVLLYKKLDFILKRTKSTKTVIKRDEELFMKIINKSDDFDLDDYDFDEVSEEYNSLLTQIKNEQFQNADLDFWFPTSDDLFGAINFVNQGNLTQFNQPDVQEILANKVLYSWDLISNTNNFPNKNWDNRK